MDDRRLFWERIEFIRAAIGFPICAILLLLRFTGVIDTFLFLPIAVPFILVYTVVDGYLSLHLKKTSFDIVLDTIFYKVALPLIIAAQIVPRLLNREWLLLVFVILADTMYLSLLWIGFRIGRGLAVRKNMEQ